jgi:ATP phosphoribosyltransferase regulatory subunit
MLENTEYAKNIRIDFSVVNDMNYYDDIVCKGFIEGIGEGVLSGGRYDKMLHGMRRKSGGIGFAVYLDLLEGFHQEKNAFDVDILLLYDDNADLQKLAATVQKLVAAGNSVCTQKSEKGIRYAKLVKFAEVEND